MHLLNQILSLQPQRASARNPWQRLHLDMPLLLGIGLLIGCGLVILYSASNENWFVMGKQIMRFVIATVVMLVMAQIPPERYRSWAPWLFVASTFLLAVVLVIGHTGKGAERWLNLGLFRFQPAELMKLAIPVALAWYFSEKTLPPRLKNLCVAGLMILVPVLLTAKQPDLGTALILAVAGGSVLIFAGLPLRYIIGGVATLAASMPVLWHFMHEYQRQRVLTFLYPERDPLGSGYHIIQSKIAIGSGGIFGKGWLHGTQSHLAFLPEHATDFIFSVCGEEFGLMGGIILLSIYSFVAIRGLYIATQAPDNFTRLLAASISLTFFISVFINIGMVSGILPVVGVPLPLISYGGTSIVTLMASFGILMSIHTHRRLVSGSAYL